MVCFKTKYSFDIQVVKRDPAFKDLSDKELIDITRIEDQKLAIQAQLEETKISGCSG